MHDTISFIDEYIICSMYEKILPVEGKLWWEHDFVVPFLLTKS